MRTPRARPECRGLSPPLRLEHDACAVLYLAHPGEVEPGPLELSLERERLLRRQRHEEPTRGLGVVGEREQFVGHALALHVRAGEVAVARVAAGADTVACRLDRAFERRERRGAEPEADATSLSGLVRVAEETEARHVRNC